jgi:hypothetical protein
MRLSESRRGDVAYSGPGVPRQRRPKSHRRKPEHSRRLRRRIALVGVVCGALFVVIAAVSYAVLVASDRSTTQQAEASSSAAGAGVSPAETRQLTRWLAANVAKGASVAVPPALLNPVRTGAPRLKVRTYDDARAVRADLLVVTRRERARSAEVRAEAASAFPVARLAGTDGVEVRQLAGSSGLAGRATEARKLAVAGAQLAQNPRVDVPDTDVPALRAGQVDSRLLVTLATVAAQYDVTADLVADPLGAPGSVAYREARVTAVDGTPVANDPKAAEPISTFVRAQKAPFSAAEAGVRGTAFVLRYALPTPLGLLDSSEIPTISP